MRQILLLLLLGLSLTLQAQSPFVVGYLPYYRFALKDQLAFDKLTHINLAFLNPDTLGNWSIGGEDIQPVIQQARMLNPSVKIYISIAGGAISPEWEAAYDKFMPANMRSAFIHSLIVYLEQNQLDGVDVDLEWSHVNVLYSPFVLELHDSLTVHNKGMSAALPGTYRYPDISDQALASFDWINLMAYDLTGPWAPNNPGPHSPLSFAQQSITHWQGQGLSPQQMVLGVPFYGYDFTNINNITAFTFGSMVAQDTAYAWQDQVGQKYYNGIPTIRNKTLLAVNNCAGIMIWEIGQDAFGLEADYSLLKAIDAGLQSINAAPPDWRNDLFLGPNPFSETLYLQSSEIREPLFWELSDLNGRQIEEGELKPYSSDISIPLGHISDGIYLMRITDGNRMYYRKLIKQ